jgi:hypothetical protein
MASLNGQHRTVRVETIHRPLRCADRARFARIDIIRGSDATDFNQTQTGESIDEARGDNFALRIDAYCAFGDIGTNADGRNSATIDQNCGPGDNRPIPDVDITPNHSEPRQ